MNKAIALSIFEAGVKAVLPSVFIPQFLERKDDEFRVNNQWVRRASYKRLVVLSMGKAAAAMAWEVHGILGDWVTDALVITKDEHALDDLPWPQVEAGHPVPNEASILAGLRVKELVETVHKQDFLLVLLSGGASALVADLPDNCQLEEVRTFYQQLLASGASIDEMNAVRKHFSAIKGGQLGRLAGGATVHVGVLSDVPGDDLSVIASGPFFPDNSSFADVEKLLGQYQMMDKLPPGILAYLKQGLKDARLETPKPGDPVFDTIHHHLLATNQLALQAAADKALQLKLDPVVFQSLLEGEARELAETFIRQCLDEMESRRKSGQYPAICFLAGGETTVTLTGEGKGGRNQEFVLAILSVLYTDPDLAALLQNYSFAVLSGGTDGTDGPTDAAGAVIDNQFLLNLKELALDPVSFLQQHNAYPFFQETGGLVKTGPTQTNVMDLLIILLQHKAPARPVT